MTETPSPRPRLSVDALAAWAGLGRPRDAAWASSVDQGLASLRQGVLAEEAGLDLDDDKVRETVLRTWYAIHLISVTQADVAEEIGVHPLDLAGPAVGAVAASRHRALSPAHGPTTSEADRRPRPAGRACARTDALAAWADRRPRDGDAAFAAGFDQDLAYLGEDVLTGGAGLDLDDDKVRQTVLRTWYAIRLLSRSHAAAAGRIDAHPLDFAGSVVGAAAASRHRALSPTHGRSPGGGGSGEAADPGRPGRVVRRGGRGRRADGDGR